MQATGRKINILYLCTGNTCRSQMAEGYTNALLDESFQAYSAGVKAQKRVDPLAVEVMKEDGIDISNHYPKTLEELRDVQFDYVVTVCDNAQESCPIFPSRTRTIHHRFDDPPRLAQGMKSDEALLAYRRVRDEIKSFIQSLPQNLK